jgi:ureidoacrylate peracid hydrolase
MTAPHNVALLVIDMQNGFVHPEGSIPRRSEPMRDVANVVAETARLIEATRQASLPIICTTMCSTPTSSICWPVSCALAN